MKFRSPITFGSPVAGPVKTLVQAPVQKTRRKVEVLSSETMEDTIQKAISIYSGVQATLSDTIGAKIPPNNPYELAALLQSNGYHSRAVRIKVTATVGQGYTASPALRACIDRPNGEYNFQTLLRRWCFDKVTHGNAYVNIVSNGRETALWHQEAIKMRVKQQTKNDKVFVYYNYDVSTGYMGYAEYPEFEYGCIGEGVRQFKALSETGNYWYGDPDYLAIKPLLEVNANIVQSALLFFKRGLQTDTAVIVKGADLGPEEEESIRQVFNQSFVGIKNARKVLLLQVGQNEEITFEKLSASLQDEATSKTRSDNRDEIIAVHGIPRALFGVMGSNSLGGGGESEAAMDIFKQLWADDHQSECEEFWQNLFEDLGFPEYDTFKLNPIKSATASVAATDLALLTDKQILTPQEALAEWQVEKAAPGVKALHFIKALSQSLGYGE